VARPVIVAVALLLGASAAMGAPPAPAVTWAHGVVSAEFRGVPLDEAIAALARETGVEFRGELRDSREITARFERARFREVVDRLVGEQNFTITYDAAGNPRRVHLLSMPRHDVEPPRLLERFAGLVARKVAVDLPPVLATALGVPRSLLPWALRRGLRHRDPAVGAAAASLFVRHVDSDPALRDAMMRADDQALVAMLRAWAGLGLPRVVAAFVTQPRDPLLRSKARRIQEQLPGVTPETAATPAA
jgi:hypothetical protein